MPIERIYFILGVRIVTFGESSSGARFGFWRYRSWSRCWQASPYLLGGGTGSPVYFASVVQHWARGCPTAVCLSLPAKSRRSFVYGASKNHRHSYTITEDHFRSILTVKQWSCLSAPCRTVIIDGEHVSAWWCKLVMPVMPGIGRIVKIEGNKLFVQGNA